ncbi:hypothetical protein GQ600_6934 [Phytophthora cactorum]|nr:hypothetical protein GQ600_6934 [Phytophthora cactorum]
MSTSTDFDTLPCNPNTSGSSEWTIDAEDFDLLTTEVDLAPTRAGIRKWPQELKYMRKLELHRKRMTRFRGRRTVEKKSMHEEFRRLQRELEQRLLSLRRNGVRGGQVQLQMQQLVLEREQLREECVTLRQNLARFRNFTLVIQSARNSGNYLADPTKPTAMSQCVASSLDGNQSRINQAFVCTSAGQFIVFLSSIHPTEIRRDSSLSRQQHGQELFDLAWAGVYLGWNVYHGSVTPGKIFYSLMSDVVNEWTIRSAAS